jgi:hypothetical protein
LFGYINTAAIILSVLLTAGIAIVYGMFRTKYKLYKQKPELAYASNGEAIDLNRALIESRYMLYPFFISSLATVLNLYQLA